MGLLILIVFSALFGGFVFRVLLCVKDLNRIRDFLLQRGDRAVTADMLLFVRGWFSDLRTRSYRVTYVDRAGVLHEAYCRTSSALDIRFMEERVVVR